MKIGVSFFLHFHTRNAAGMTKADYLAHFEKEYKVWKNIDFDMTRAKSVVFRCLLESLTCTVPELVSRCLNVELLRGFRVQPNMLQNALIRSECA